MYPFHAATVFLRYFMDTAAPADAFVFDGSWFGHPGTVLIDDYAGTTRYREMLQDKRYSVQDIVQAFAEDTNSFLTIRKPFLLYP